MLEFYDFPESVCCQKVRLVIAEKGVAFKEHLIMLDQEMQYSDRFLDLNPKGVVPVIVHNGHTIDESTIINEYINEAFEGPDLMPADPYWRARKRSWSLLLDTGIHSPHTTAISFVVALRFPFLDALNTPEKIEAYLNNVRDPLSRDIQAQAFENDYASPFFDAAVRAFGDFLANMNKALDESTWLAGDQISLADLDVAPYVHRLECLGLENMWSNKPSITDWYTRMKSRPSWDEAIQKPHIEKWLKLMEMGGKDAWPKVEKILNSIDNNSK